MRILGFLYFSIKMDDAGSHQKCLDEALVMRTQYLCCFFFFFLFFFVFYMKEFKEN